MSLFWALVLTLLVSMVILPNFRKDVLGMFGINLRPDSDGNKVVTAMITVGTVYLSLSLLGWFWTAIAAVVLCVYLKKVDADSVVNGLFALLRRIKDGVTGNSSTTTARQTYGIPPLATQPRPAPTVTPPAAPPVSATPPAPRPASKIGQALKAGERITLQNPPPALSVHIGADHLQTSGINPLAVSCTLVGDGGQVLEHVTADRRGSNDNSVFHSGDSGHLTVNLRAVAANVKALVFVAISREKPFRLVPSAVLQVADAASLTSGVCCYDLPLTSEKQAMIVARLYRHNGGWKVAAIGETFPGSTAADLVPAIQQLS
ncbi:MAG: TerD family protein [Candidatus Obscuribacterales bacterium]|nr:TerD family protein [Candidatus Obscuribacterales bacterium]